MKNHSSIYAIVFAMALVLPAPTAEAQSIALAPAQVVQKFKPGVPFEIDLSTQNGGSGPVEISVQITDFWYNEKNEKVFSEPGTSPHSAANWIQFVPEHFSVAPGSSQKLRAIVTPPKDATGGYYATLFVLSKPQLAFSGSQTKDGKQVYTNMRVGCLVLLAAENTEQLKIELSNVKLTPPTANRGLELTLDLLNAGNSHIFPVARVAVLDARRKLVGKADSQEKRFLPGQKDTMHVSWAGNLLPGDYTAILTVAYGEDRIETQQIPFSVSAP